MSQMVKEPEVYKTRIADLLCTADGSVSMAVSAPRAKQPFLLKAVYAPRVSRPRRAAGSDWGALRHVIARQRDRELWWWGSCKSWAGLLHGYTHTPGKLCLAFAGDDKGRGIEERPCYTVLCEGGRAGTKMFLTYWQQIDAFFGWLGVSKLLKTNKTLMLPPPPTTPAYIMRHNTDSGQWTLDIHRKKPRGKIATSLSLYPAVELCDRLNLIATYNVSLSLPEGVTL